MKYYKIIQNNNFIGVVNSDNFIYYHPYDHVFIRTNEVKGQYIEYGGKLYRDTWMPPIPNNIDTIYERGLVVEIDKDIYDSFQTAIEKNEIIEINDEEPTPININIIDPIEETSIEFIKASKITEMSYYCRTTIEDGFDLELRGEMHHFSLDTQDQLNLISLSAMAQTQEYIPYHADGESCIFYTAEEMGKIIEAATAFKIYHTTYYNALKGYINSLNDIGEIAEIQYGIEIPEEYQSDVLKALAQ